MSDLRILEGIISVLLFLYIVRPFVRRFRGIDGLSVLPAVSLALAAGLFAAYGFRPEALPLAFFALVVFFGSVPRMFDIARKLRTDDYGERNPAVAVIGATALFLCAAFAVAFAPVGLDLPSPGSVSRFTARDSSRGVEVSFILESPAGAEPRPLVVYVPPVLGSAGMTVGLRSELVARGFVVLSCYRVGLDLPAEDERGKVRLPSAEHARDVLSAVLWGRSFAFAAEAGVRIELEREADLEFALGFIRGAASSGDPRFASVDVGNATIVGYGAGGAAALLYAAARPDEAVRAVVAIESPVFSALAFEPERPRPSAASAESSFADRAIAFASSAAASLKIRRVLGPAREVPSIAGVPSVLVVSDSIRSMKARDSRYATEVRIFRNARAGSRLVSYIGAGPFHFSDVPWAYPAYAFFARGRGRPAAGAAYYVERAADLCRSLSVDGIENLAAGPDALIEKND